MLAHEQLALASRLVVLAVPLRVGLDRRVDEPQLAVALGRVRVAQHDLAVAQRLDLGAHQHEAGLDPLEDLELVPRAAVGDDRMLARSHRPRVLPPPARPPRRRPPPRFGPARRARPLALVARVAPREVERHPAAWRIDLGDHDVDRVAEPEALAVAAADERGAELVRVEAIAGVEPAAGRKPSYTSEKRTNRPGPISPVISPVMLALAVVGEHVRRSRLAGQMPSARRSMSAASRSADDACSRELGETLAAGGPPRPARSLRAGCGGTRDRGSGGSAT